MPATDNVARFVGRLVEEEPDRIRIAVGSLVLTLAREDASLAPVEPGASLAPGIDVSVTVSLPVQLLDLLEQAARGPHRMTFARAARSEPAPYFRSERFERLEREFLLRHGLVEK